MACKKFLNKQSSAHKAFAVFLINILNWYQKLQLAMIQDPKTPTGLLWVEKAGKEAAEVFENIAAAADHGGTIAARDYVDIVSSILSEIDERDPVKPHPQVLIWGTLEARGAGG